MVHFFSLTVIQCRVTVGEQIYRLKAFKRFIKGLQMTQNDPKIVKILLFVV